MRGHSRTLRYLAAIGSVFLAVVLLRRMLVPADWVELHLTQVPANVSSIYPVARIGGKTVPMKWYQSMLVPFLADPKYHGEQWYWTVRGTERKGEVQWLVADSYGLLAQRESGSWVLWWVNPQHISGPSPVRYIFGGGAVTMQADGIESASRAPQSLLEQVKTDNR